MLCAKEFSRDFFAITTIGLNLQSALDWNRHHRCCLYLVCCRGEAMYPSVDDVTYGGEGKVPEAAVDRMVSDLEKQ